MDNIAMQDSFKALEEKAKQVATLATSARQKAAIYDNISNAILKGVRGGSVTFYVQGSGSPRAFALSEAELTRTLEVIGHERGKELEALHTEIQKLGKDL